jgi:Type IV secretion system pilin
MKSLINNKYGFAASILKYSFVIIIAFSLFGSAKFAIADCHNPPQGGDVCPPASSSGKSELNIGIKNPLSGINDLNGLIVAILNIVLVIGVPIITLAIIYCGFLFVQAQGNSEQVTQAKSALLYTIIGAALLLGAFVIANAIQGTVNDIKSGA